MLLRCNKDFEYLSKTQMCLDTKKMWKRLKTVAIKREISYVNILQFPQTSHSTKLKDRCIA